MNPPIINSAPYFPPLSVFPEEMQAAWNACDLGRFERALAPIAADQSNHLDLSFANAAALLAISISSENMETKGFGSVNPPRRLMEIALRCGADANLGPVPGSNDQSLLGLAIDQENMAIGREISHLYNEFCRNNLENHDAGQYQEVMQKVERRLRAEGYAGNMGLRGGVMSALLQAGANPNTSRPPLTRAVAEDNVFAARLLLEKGARIDTPPDLFVSATERGQLEMMALLLDHGAEIDAEGGRVLSPLGLALRYGESETASFLLEKGADPNAGSIPAWLCAVYLPGREEISLLPALFEHGADISFVNSQGQGALHYWATGYSCRPPGATPNHLTNPQETLDFLISKGAPMDTLDLSGKSPLDCLERALDPAIVEMFRERLATWDAKKLQMRTAPAKEKKSSLRL